MDPPRTPGRTKYASYEPGQSYTSSTTAASPFNTESTESPRFRASTKAYGTRTRSYVSPRAQSPGAISGSGPGPISQNSSPQTLEPPLRAPRTPLMDQPNPVDVMYTPTNQGYQPAAVAAPSYTPHAQSVPHGHSRKGSSGPHSTVPPSSPPTPRAPTAPRRQNHSNDSMTRLEGSEGPLVVPRTPSASASARAYRRTPSSSHNYHPQTPEKPSSSHTPHETSNGSRKLQKRTSIGPWEFVKSIGAGSMGQVKLAVNRNTRQTAAVKIVPKAFTLRNKDGRESNDAKDARVVREAAIGRLLNHPNVAKLYDVYSMTGHFYLVFEYINGGQMLDYIIAHGCVKEAQARRFARSICSALEYCHENSVVHRDLKIENILIADNGDIKLIDFGLSNLFRRTDLLRTFCGSLYFAAPELLNALPYVGPEIDVWSFGVVLYVLVCGKVPFEDKSMTMLHAKIKRGAVEYPTWLSTQCVDLLRKMLTVNPDTRATLADVSQHPWIMKGYDLPPVSMVPRRTPLNVHALDHAVFEEMEALGIGQASQLEHALRYTLESNEYKHAVDAWYDRQQIDLSLAADEYLSEHLQSPLNSFAPEISCYFLTRERMARMPHNTHARTPSQSSQSHLSPKLQPQLAQPLPLVPTPTIQVVPDEPLQIGRARARTIGDSSSLKPPVPVQPALVPNIQQAQVGLMAPSTAVKSIDITPVKASNDHRVVSQPLPRREVSSSSSGSGNTVLVPGSVSNQVGNALVANNGLNIPNTNTVPGSLFRKLTIRRKTGHARAKSTSHAHEVQRKPHEEIPPTSGMPSIESPKQVYFRGIFSVQTTSTKPLREIRSEIIRVLNQRRIEFVEVKGGFACVARPNQMREEHLRTPSRVSKPLSRTSSRGSFQTTPNSSLSTPKSELPPSTPPSTPRQHRRMVSENGVLSPIGSNGGSLESIDMEIGASDMLGGNTQKSSIPVRFEVDIVRLPIIALHGIQFKKMTGNVWLYKNLAQGILEDLRI